MRRKTYMKGVTILEDKYIFNLFKSNREEALELLVDKYKNPLYKFCFHICRNQQEAEELFQDTWIKVFKNFNSYDESKNFQTWIFTIAVNSYKDKYRKAKRWLNKIKDYFDNEEKEREIESIQSFQGIPEEQLMIKAEKESLIKAVRTLEDNYKIPLILYYFKGLSYKDISEIMQMPEGTIKSRLNTARKKLKEIMEV